MKKRSVISAKQLERNGKTITHDPDCGLVSDPIEITDAKANDPEFCRPCKVCRR